MIEQKKSVLITGIKGGIGSALAFKFHQAGYRVFGLDIQKNEPLDHMEFFQVDLNKFCNDEEYRNHTSDLLNDKISQLDVLINNAAIQILGHLDEIKFNDWQTTLNVNLTAPFLLSQLFLDKLEACKGSIINIGSIHQQQTKSKFVSYATSKSALIGLTKSLAVDLQDKVRVNAISPAAIETDMLQEGFNYDESAINELREIHPVRKIGKPEDVANLALFLSSENLGFIHGANIAIDGGISSVLKDL
jgi:NAD(P)-dependent dehydrogenase (short-subunit alcohol dehydrogenase family)